MGEYTRIKSPYDGGTYTNSGMVDLIRTYCAIRGYPSLKDISVMQGSFNTTVAASAGTHKLADCVDLSEYDWKVKDRIFRSIGGAIFHRTRAQGFAPHCHMVRMYSTAMAWLATAQDKAYRTSAANGLGNLSHKDVEWMPRYRGVRHLSGPEEGKQFIATKATPGYSQAGSDPKNDKDLIKHNRAKGYVISGVAGRVRCQGKDYFIVSAGKDDMTFYLVADFNAYVPGWVAKTEKWVMAPAPSSATIYGRTAPGPDAPKKAGSVYPEATGHKLTSIGYEIVKGVKYVSTANGTWFTTTSLAPAVATPTVPAKAKSFTETVITQNVIANRLSPTKPAGISDWKKGATYGSRVPLMARMINGHRAHVVLTQEAGTAADADKFTDALDGSWSHLRGGDHFQGGDITQTINTATVREKRLDSGTITISPAGPGGSHNIVPWEHLQHIESGIEWFVFTPHLIAGAGNDRDREQQMDDLIVKAEAIAKGKPVLIGGDWNSYLEQPYDGPGKALKKHGYLDAELSPCAGVNTGFDSYNGLHNPPYKHARQFDRFAAKPELIRFDKREVLLNLDDYDDHRTPWPSDHQPVAVDITVYRTK